MGPKHRQLFRPLQYCNPILDVPQKLAGIGVEDCLPHIQECTLSLHTLSSPFRRAVLFNPAPYAFTRSRTELKSVGRTSLGDSWCRISTSGEQWPNEGPVSRWARVSEHVITATTITATTSTPTR